MQQKVCTSFYYYMLGISFHTFSQQLMEVKTIFYFYIKEVITTIIKNFFSYTLDFLNLSTLVIELEYIAPDQWKRIEATQQHHQHTETKTYQKQNLIPSMSCQHEDRFSAQCPVLQTHIMLSSTHVSPPLYKVFQIQVFDISNMTKSIVIQ